jgi:hypothetical protein
LRQVQRASLLFYLLGLHKPSEPLIGKIVLFLRGLRPVVQKKVIPALYRDSSVVFWFGLLKNAFCVHIECNRFYDHPAGLGRVQYGLKYLAVYRAGLGFAMNQIPLT